MLVESVMLKPPKAPDRPLVPYMRFSRKLWAKVRAEHPDSQLWDIGKIIGQMWRDAPESEKLAYQQEYEIEKAEYEKALKAYHNSAAYQQYVSAKNRAKMADKTGTVGSVIANSRGRLESGGVVIQPAEDDELTDLSSRRVAAVRFDRNHRLIADLFNGSVVTDTRTIVVQNRIDMLKKQANSLSSHQAINQSFLNKLEEELKSLEVTFNEKKRQMERASDEFAAKLKKVCEERPQVDEAKYLEMTEEWEKKLLKAYGEFTAKEEEKKKRQMVEREQLAEETPILYSLTVGESSPSPKSKENESSKSVHQNTSTVTIVPAPTSSVSTAVVGQEVPTSITATTVSLPTTTSVTPSTSLPGTVAPSATTDSTDASKPLAPEAAPAPSTPSASAKTPPSTLDVKSSSSDLMEVDNKESKPPEEKSGKNESESAPTQSPQKQSQQ
uniref:HMG box domain-containing protein n=1 Tax=Syphacia muris TaxID=451379 RepID=A0A0N5AP79_9BILA